MKHVLNDRDEFKLIERVCSLRKSFADVKVGEIQRPLVIGGVADGTYSVEVEY